MGVFLTILKIIGIVLLSILGLLLLLLLIVLLAPIHYKGDASFDEARTAHVRVGWMLFIRVFADLNEDGTFAYGVRLFGKQFYPKKKKEEETTQAAAEGESPGKSDEAEPKVQKADAESDAGKPGEGQPDEAKTDTALAGDGADDDEAEEETGKEALPDKLARIAEKAAGIVENTAETVYDQEKKTSLFFRRKSTKESIGWLKTALYKLGNHVRPKKLAGEIEFGFDDPAVTGYVAALASQFYDCYAEQFDLTPNFDGQIVKGRVEFNGRVVLGYIAVIALRLYMRKHFRQFIKNALALKNDTLKNAEKIKDGIINYG